MSFDLFFDLESHGRPSFFQLPLKLLEVLDNVRRVLAIEILCAVQGIDYRAPLEAAAGTARIAAVVREQVPSLTGDRSLSNEIEIVANLIADGSLTA